MKQRYAGVISPAHMVFGRTGTGGPQLAEVSRMLSDQGSTIAAERAWLMERTDDLERAETALEAGFAALLD
ncbi:MAG: hypothetical protein ACXW20_06580 [Burkholderiales bacterium]